MGSINELLVNGVLVQQSKGWNGQKKIKIENRRYIPHCYSKKS